MIDRLKKALALMELDGVESVPVQVSREELRQIVEALEGRKRGEWIDKSGGIEGAWNYCSICGEQAIDLYDFCPNCGADMRGEQK